MNPANKVYINFGNNGVNRWSWLYSWHLLVIWSIGLTVAATLHKYWLGTESYNNFLIFRASFLHLVQGLDLYTLFPAEHFDYYKYSPSFAFFMAPLSVLPTWAGVTVWNVLNTAVLLLGVYRLPVSQRSRALIVWIIIVELLTSLQNFQSNALIVGLMLLTFDALERRKPGYAALWITLLLHIKVFGAAIMMLMFFYPEKLRFVRSVLLWIVAVTALPLLVVAPERLFALYRSWYDLLSSDHAVSLGLSVYGFIVAIIPAAKEYLIWVKGALGMLWYQPLLWKKIFGHLFCRLNFVASILLWVVIANHKAESPTYIIAMTGIALWYVVQLENTSNNRLFRWQNIVLWGSILFTSFSVTDVFPRFMRDEIFSPFMIKAIPAMIVWILLQYTLWTTPATAQIAGREKHVA